MGITLHAQQDENAFLNTTVGKEAFENSPHIDAAKALYGKAAGLNVYQGKGESAFNTASFTIHGQRPIVVVDGFIRDFTNITPSEIESVTILKDAVASALYGIRGGNGVVMIKTKEGSVTGLKVGVNYQIGISTHFRTPQFADAYTYASKYNEALSLDGLSPKYTPSELQAFKDHSYPYYYPDVDWMKEVYNDVGMNHRVNLRFNGGTKRFRYYAIVDYMHDTGFVKNLNKDKRIYSRQTDTRLSIRGNINAKISKTTDFDIRIVGKIAEDNRPNYGNNFHETVWKIPSAAFPIFQVDGIYGGSQIYGASNPYALLASTGNHKNTHAVLLADAELKQDFSFWVKGLSAELALSFDDYGKMFDKTAKEYRYEELNPTITPEGDIIYASTIFGKDSQTLDHSNGLMSTYLRTMFQGRIKYHLDVKRNIFDAALVYDMQSYIASGRNNSTKRQGVFLNASYCYDKRYAVNAIVNYSGSAFLPKGHRYGVYPAVSAQWNIHNESFMKGIGINKMQLYASYGLSGWDGNLSHELYLHNYGAGNSYTFTTNVTEFGGMSEGRLPVENLKAELSEKVNGGFTIETLRNRLSFNIEGFYEKRSNILVPANSTSGIIGIEMGQINAGIQEYKGFDARLGWNERDREFKYGANVILSYVDSKIIEDNQEFQEYDYLYHKGNRVGQYYGLEAIGIFKNDLEVKRHTPQTFSECKAGDIKYKDQNGDNKIDEKDRIKIGGTSIPRLYYGLDLNLGYKGFELSATFQGIAGKSVSLLDSPLYTPIMNNGNISEHFINNEISWSVENAENATMPRLTTLENKNNYQASSFWIRNGAYFKLRDLRLAYTFSKKMTRFADLQLYLQGTNLFSIDSIGFADPEQLKTNYPTSRCFWLGIKMNF